MLKAGDRLGPFVAIEAASRGGTSEVWRGEHVATGRAVALKVLRADAMVTSLAEVAACGRLDHPGIVPILEVGLVDGQPWLASPWFSGGTLQERPCRSWSEVRTLTLTLLDALCHAHARGILHRDVKPRNILWDDDAEAWALADFGIAHHFFDEAPADLRTMGTPWYVAPEQLLGQRARQRPWTDLYSLACVVWHLATGAPPFPGPKADAVAGHLHHEPPPFRPRFPVPDGLGPWLSHLLAKRPESRATYAADAAAVLAALPMDVAPDAAIRDLPPGDDTLDLDGLIVRVGRSDVGGPPLPAAPSCPLPEPPPPSAHPALAARVAALRTPSLPRDRLVPLWAALLDVRATGRSRILRVAEADLAYALATGMSVAATETAQAWLLYVGGDESLSRGVVRALAMPGDPSSLPSLLQARFAYSVPDADRLAAGLLEGRVAAAVELALRAARERTLVVLMPEVGAGLAPFVEAFAELEASVLCMQHGAPLGELLPVPPLTTDDLRRMFAAACVGDPERLEAWCALGFRGARRASLRWATEQLELDQG